MEMKTCLRALCVLGAFTHGSAALAVIDDNAPVVKLRDPANGGCTEAGVGLNNCFTGSNGVNDLTAWIVSTRKPNAASPLLVDVGSGTYPRLTCDGWGFTTFRGAGRTQTTFGSSSGTNPKALHATNGCTEVEFQNMTFKASGFLSRGVNWNSNGNSRWVNVEVIGESYGWYDTVSGGKHYWFSSKIRSTGTPYFLLSRTYKTVSENWFFGSELQAQATASAESTTALDQLDGGDTHFYGSVIRVEAGAAVTTPLYAITVSGSNSTVHIHGTGIDVISVEANNITALTSVSGGKIHADGAAYNLRTGSGGSITRVSGEGHDVHAPYLWSGHATPPDIISQDGADTAVVTSETGGTPRLVIYSTACDSKWFDVGSNDCRP